MALRSAPHEIDTARLHLRPPRIGDAEAVFHRYASDADVTRYMTFRRHETLADTELFLDFSRLEWSANGCGPYLIFSKATDVLLGGAGLSLHGNEAETGYLLARDSWGCGYATESLLAMVDVGRTMGLRAMTAHCHPDHRASMHVLEKCGFVAGLRSTASHVFPNISTARQDVLSYELNL